MNFLLFTINEAARKLSFFLLIFLRSNDGPLFLIVFFYAYSQFLRLVINNCALDYLLISYDFSKFLSDTCWQDSSLYINDIND